MDIIDVIIKYRVDFAGAIGITALLFAGAGTIGTTLGVLLSIASINKYVRVVVAIAAGAVLSVPIIVLLYWFHFPVQRALGIVVPPLWTALAVLAAVQCSVVFYFVAPALRQLRSEWGPYLGMYGIRGWRAAISVYRPLLMRVAGPPVVQAHLVLLHLSLLSSVISVPELLRIAQRVATHERGAAMSVYAGMAVLFIAITLPSWWLLERWRVRMSREVRDRPA